MASSNSPRRGRSTSKRGTSKTRSISPTPPLEGNSRSNSRSKSPPALTSANPNAQFEKAFLRMMKNSLDDEEDYKSIKLPVFSDGSEWEAVIFELKINLEKVWKHSKEMDIVDYLEGIQ